MPCERCFAQFTVLRRRRSCGECGRSFCGACVIRYGGGGGSPVCDSCRVLVARPLPRHQVDSLRVRDLQCFLRERHVSTAGCVEKEDLVELVVAHQDDPPAPRRPNGDLSHAIQQIKGFTQNLFQQAFDDKPKRRPPPRPPRNPTAPTAPVSPVPPVVPETPVPPAASATPATPVTPATPAGETSRSPTDPVPIARPRRPSVPPRPPEGALADTHDCLEIEDDPDDPDREPASASLPGDSELLLVDEETFRRAASEPELPSAEPGPPGAEEATRAGPAGASPRVELADLRDRSQLEGLKVRQLKELLALNRVDFKGCCERKELLERAERLWRETAKSREDLGAAAGGDELCRICMDAPMECVMLECGHIATCLGCGKRLHECPICREYVVRVVRFFRS